MSDPEFEATVETIFQAFNDRRFGDFASYMTEDLVETFPQSGERIEGRDRQQAAHEAYASPPTFTVRRVRRSGDLAVVEADEQYADGSIWHDIFILELADGSVASMTVYFSQAFDAPEWRGPYRVAP